MSDAVLVVEDDVDVRESLMLVLESEGYRTVGAANGREALDVLSGDEPVCLILLDLMMPVMDGWEFRAAQRRDPTIAGIPVIAGSAAVLTADLGARLHAAAYVRKPVPFDELLGLVAQYCAR